MSFQVYHQLGYRYNWNISSIIEDNAGQGIIIGPRYIEKRKVEQLEDELKVKAIFDPQFFIPGTAKGFLTSYDFFPQIVSDGYDTDSFGDESASKCAEECINFQIRNNFKFVVIPTRRTDGMPTDFIEKQNIQFVEAFAKALFDSKCYKPVLLQLILNNNMINDDEYIRDILNWLTGMSFIDGIYLITETSFTSKQIKDNDYLYNLLSIINILKSNDLDVVLGYLNTEAVLLSISSPDIMTIGGYENLRRFSKMAFEQSDDERRAGPKPRLYFTKLLQWVDHGYLNAMRRRLSDFDDLIDRNKYQAEMFKAEFNWHFTKPQIYKHYFLEFNKQLEYISSKVDKERYLLVNNMLDSAIGWFDRINSAGIVLSPDDDGSHLFRWQTALNEFSADMGWK